MDDRRLFLTCSSSRKREDGDKRPLSRLIDAVSIKLALFPAIFPVLYTALRQRFGKNGTVAEPLSSTLLVLLPKSIRIQFALYTASAALLHTGRGSAVRRILPPVWTLNILGNAILLWAFLFRSNAFPRSYERVILSASLFLFAGNQVFNPLPALKAIRPFGSIEV